MSFDVDVKQVDISNPSSHPVPFVQIVLVKFFMISIIFKNHLVVVLIDDRQAELHRKTSFEQND